MWIGNMSRLIEDYIELVLLSSMAAPKVGVPNRFSFLSSNGSIAEVYEVLLHRARDSEVPSGIPPPSV